MPNITAYIGIGSNLGIPEENCIKAIKKKSSSKDIKIISKSSFYQTEPIGGAQQGWFINSAIEIETNLSPKNLLSVLLTLELTMGRIRKEKWGPRLIDLDLLLYDNLVLKSKSLTLPHPEIQNRKFVLIPMSEIAENLIFDTEKEIYGTLPPSLDRLVRRSRTLLHHSFPGWRFTHDAAPPEWLDLGRLSSRARECVIDWSLHQIDRPVSIETEFPDIGQIRSARASVRLILSQREPKHLELVRLDVHAHSGRILSELCLPGIPEPVPLKFGVVMERIDDRASRRNLAASRWLALLNRHPAGYLILADPSLLEDPMIQSAIDRPIGGDEAWANSVEALHPLAAWLATPSDEHRSRWQRIHSSIDDRWIGLIDPSSLPFDELVSWSMRAPESWRSRAAKVIERQISRHPDRLAELVVEIARQDSDASSWLSTIIIQGHRNLPSELAHQSLEISISRWCARPCKPVVSTLESLVDQELVDVDWGHLKQSGRIRTDLIQLSNWISLVEQIEHGRSPSQEWASLHLLELPESWWSAKAPDWLNHWVEERTNGPWLLSIIESWPNLLLRPAGSLSGPPSTPPLQYPGIDSTFLPVLEDIRGACLSSGQNLNLGHLASLDDEVRKRKYDYYTRTDPDSVLTGAYKHMISGEGEFSGPNGIELEELPKEFTVNL